MKMRHVLFATTFLICSVPVSQTPVSATRCQIPVIKEIAIQEAHCHLNTDESGNRGVCCEFSVKISGLKGHKVESCFTPRLLNGSCIKASTYAPASSIDTSGNLQWRQTMSVQKNLQVVRPAVFVPFKAMRLSDKVENFVIRGHISSGEISSYTDFAIQPHHPEQEDINILLQSIRVEYQEIDLSFPNPSGKSVKTPNFQVKKRFLLFLSRNRVTSFAPRILYSGVFFRLPEGGYIFPSSECPEYNIGPDGQAQFQKTENVQNLRMERREMHLKVPLNALAIDLSDANRVIAVYYISSDGLWSVRKFEIMIPDRSELQLISE